MGAYEIGGALALVLMGFLATLSAAKGKRIYAARNGGGSSETYNLAKSRKIQAEAEMELRITQVLDERQKEINELKSQLKTLSAEVSEASIGQNERLAYLEKTHAAQSQEITDLHSTVAKLEKELQVKDEALTEAAAKEQTMIDELAELRKRVTKLEGDFSALLIEKNELAKRLAETEEKLRILEHENQKVTVERDALQKGMDTIHLALAAANLPPQPGESKQDTETPEQDAEKTQPIPALQAEPEVAPPEGLKSEGNK